MSTTFSSGTTTGSFAGTSSYPIDVQIDAPANPGKLYAIPIIGLLIRSILLIPHFIALIVLGVVVLVLQLVTWIPVLFTGKYPEGLFNFVSGTFRWGARVMAYYVGLTDTYPPFGLADVASYPVRVSFEYPQESNRLWAIPLAYYVKELILLPHLIVLVALYYVVQLVMLVAWIPVLFKGEYPQWAFSLNSGYIRWSVRVYGFLLGLSDQYPPFQLGV